MLRILIFTTTAFFYHLMHVISVCVVQVLDKLKENGIAIRVASPKLVGTIW